MDSSGFCAPADCSVNYFVIFLSLEGFYYESHFTAGRKGQGQEGPAR